MTARRENDSGRRRAPADRLDLALRRLGRGPATPDQTETIMHRLGFRPVDPATARRRRRRRLAGRVAMCLGGALVLVAAGRFYAGSAAVRRPTGPTIPAALQEDVDRQHRRIDRAFEGLRRLTPRPGAGMDEPAVAPRIDSTATGPGRWI